MDTSKLSIHDVLNSGMAAMVVISAKDLKQTIVETVNEAKRSMEEEIALNRSDVLLTPPQVLERLKISRTTLWHWTKKGYIAPVEIGGKTRYRLTDVNEIIKGDNDVFK